MSIALNYYSGSYNYNNSGNIYVHLHARNIGRAMEGQPINPSSVVNIFKERKQQAFEASKNQFRTLFKNSLDSKSIELLNQVFDNDDLMTELQEEMGKKFQQALSIDKMQALMDLQKTVATGKMAASILSKSQKSIKDFDILLQSLSQAAQLLGTESGARLAMLLSHQHEINNSRQLGKFLLDALSKFKKQNQKALLTDLEIQQATQISGHIKALANALATGKTGNKKKKNLTQSAIVKLVENIFNTGFAESISAILKNTVYVTLDETFKASLTGSQRVQIQYSNEFGNIIASSLGQKAYGKADAFFDNVKIKLEGSNKQVTLNVGISDKFYKLNYFPGLKGNKNKNSYSASSGGSLYQALWSSFGSNLRYLYYAYNTLGHGNEEGWSQAQGALNEVILTRQIVRLFASRGGNEDFAQFMFVNGQILPIWDIIMSTIKDISSFSSYSQPVTLSIADYNKIQNSAQNYEETLDQRIYNVNRDIQNAKISAHVNLNNL